MKKILEQDLAGRGVIGQPDSPGLSALEMQQKVEEVVREVVIPAFNENVEEAEAQAALDQAHLADRENPHGVTAKQVGAYTKGEMDLSLAGKAERGNVLERDNTAPYTPTAPYHPATKEFVEGSINTGGNVTLEQVARWDKKANCVELGVTGKNQARTTKATDRALINLKGRTQVEKTDPAAEVSPDNLATLTGVVNPTITAASADNTQSNTQAIAATLYSLPNGVCDEYDGVSGKLTRRVGKLTLDGSEDIYFSSLKDQTSFLIGIASTDSACSEASALICNCFEDKGATIRSDYTIEGCCGCNPAFGGQYLWFRIFTSRLPDLSGEKDVQSWLSSLYDLGTPVTVLYELAEPITTYEQHDLACYEGQTIISCDNPVLQDSDMAVTVADGREVFDATRLGGLTPSYYQQANPNLLINGDFQVWQRGESFNVDRDIYTADHWKVSYSTGTSGTLVAQKTENGISLKVATEFAENQSRTLLQPMEEQDFAKIAGKTVTVSYCMRLLTEDTQCVISTSNVDDVSLVGTEFKVYSVTFAIPQAYRVDGGYYLRIQSTTPVGGGIEVKWVKMELGDHATPFIPRSYAEELALCQRYYEVQEYPRAWGTIDTSSGAGNNLVVCSYPFLVEKRVSPTVKRLYSSLTNLLPMVQHGNITPTSEYAASPNKTGAYFVFKIADMTTKGQMVTIKDRSYAFDAEL